MLLDMDVALDGLVTAETKWVRSADNIEIVTCLGLRSQLLLEETGLHILRI